MKPNQRYTRYEKNQAQNKTDIDEPVGPIGDIHHYLPK
jgi:hypothetical protein